MKAKDELTKKEHLIDLQLLLRKSLFNRPYDIEDIESKALTLCDAVLDFEENCQDSSSELPDFEKLAEQVLLDNEDGNINLWPIDDNSSERDYYKQVVKKGLVKGYEIAFRNRLRK